MHFLIDRKFLAFPRKTVHMAKQRLRGKLVFYKYLQFVKHEVSNFSFIFLHPFESRLGAMAEVNQKLFNCVLSAHRLHICAKFGVCSTYDLRETLSRHADRRTGTGTNGRTDVAKSIFLIALMKNIYTIQGLTCLLRPGTYIVPKLILSFLLFLR